MSIQRLTQLDVVISRPAGLAPRVEIVDRQTLTEVISLTPVEARTLAYRLMQQAEATRPPPLPGARRRPAQ